MDGTMRGAAGRRPWRWVWGITPGALVPPGVIALALFPWVVLHARALWWNPFYRVFPLVVAGSAVVGIPAARRLGGLEPGGRLVSWGLLAVSVALLAGAGFLLSPWLGAVAGLVTALAVGFALGGRRLVAALLPAWLLLGLLIPPPFDLDLGLVSLLREATARGVDRLLDACGVLHVMEGELIDVAGRRFEAGPASGDVRLLFLMLTCVVVFVTRARRPVLHALLLAAAGLAWVLAGAVARATVVVLLAGRWRVDWGDGWRSEALGAVGFALALALTYSTDQALVCLGGWLGRWFRPAPQGGQPAGVWGLSAVLWGGPAPPVDPGPTRAPELRRTWLGSAPVLAAFGLIGVVQLALLGPVLIDVATRSPGAGARLASLGEETLPARVGPFLRREFVDERREQGDPEGTVVRHWGYEFGGRPVLATVAYPLRGWREPTGYLRSVGWTPGERVVRRGATVAGDVVEATFRHQKPGRYAYMIACAFDRDGRPLEAGRVSADWRRCLAFWERPWRAGGASWREARRQSVRLEVVVESEFPLTREELGKARAFFDRLLAELPLSNTAHRG